MKMGVRFFCIPIHPMRVGATMINSMLFNVWLLQLCSFSLIQFCFTAFRSYARFTSADMVSHAPPSRPTEQHSSRPRAPKVT